MKHGATWWTERALQGVLTAVSVLFIGAYAVLAFMHSRYPYELEWMEGGSVDHVARVLAGHGLYAPPSIEFTPFIYPPLYYYVSALFASWLGVGFFPLRLVSILSSFGCLAIIFIFVRRETRSAFLGLLSASLFAATYKIGGAWLDIARVDSLFLFLLLSGTYVVRFHRSPAALVAAGALFSLSFLTKQIALPIAIPLLAWSLLLGRRSIWLIGSCAALAGTATLILNALSGGWFGYYIFTVPSGHSNWPVLVYAFWAKDAVMCLQISLVVAAAFLYLRFADPGRSVFLFYAALVIGMLGGSCTSLMHAGSYRNAWLPAFAALAVLFGLGIRALADLIAKASPGRRGALGAGLYLACLVQLGALVYNPKEFIPSVDDRKTGAEIVAAIAAIPGDVYVPCHTDLARLAGKRSFAHQMAVRDVMRSKAGPVGARLDAEIREAIRSKRFAAIVLEAGPWEYEDEVNRYYELRRTFIDACTDVFAPVTGSPERPARLFVRRIDAPPPTGETAP